MFSVVYVEMGVTMATIGENIKMYRTQKGWSIAELARRIGKSRAAVSQYESGKITPRIGTIEDLAMVFGVQKRDIIEKRSKRPMFVDTVYDLTPEEEELIDLYNSLPASGKRAVLTGLNAYVQYTKENQQ